MAVCTSPGFCAVPEGIFSAAQTMAMTRTLGLSRAMARMAPIMAAPPAMSYFIFSMLSAGLMEMPPVSKVMPLPTRPRTGSVGDALRRVAQDDERGRLRRALRDAPESAHLEFVQLFGGVDLPVEANLLGHERGALAEDGGRELVAGLVDQRAGKVLAFADDRRLRQKRLRRLLRSAPAGAARVNDWMLWSLRSLR